jgi:hypothetical protein
MWANEFVRERLWRDDGWHASALADASLDPFIAGRMTAITEVRIKCRNNYRHLFHLCGYLPSALPLINAGADRWLAPALFLAWDRFILDGGQAAKTQLLDLLRQDELHKLLGAARADLLSQANTLADIYLEAGNLGRFSLPDTAPSTTRTSSNEAQPATTGASAIEVPEETTSAWIDQNESDATVERRIVEVQAQVRDRRKAAALKKHYDNECLFCGVRLQVAADRCYSESAHVKALGKPHNGPDRASNMIVLCPNHHLQFDRGVLRLKKTMAGYVIQSKVRGDSLHGKLLALRHELDADLVDYHWMWHAPARR